MSESKEVESTPKKLLSTVLHNELFRNALISKNNKIIADTIKNEIDRYSPGETLELVTDILDILGGKAYESEPDIRDGALEIFRIVNFSKTEIAITLDSYSKSFRDINSSSDPFGSVSSLLDAGEVIAPHIKSEQLPHIKEPLLRLKRMFRVKLSSMDYSHIEQRVNRIVDSVPKPEVLTEQAADETREGPRIFSPETALHEFYLNDVKTNGCFKVTLWKNTPRFREMAQDYGVDLARFWNLHDPEKTLGSLNQFIEEADSSTLSRVEKNLKKMIGKSISELTDDEKKAVTDEINDTMIQTYNEISRQFPDFDKVIANFKNILSEIDNYKPKTRKKALRNIVEFFKENGLDITDVKEIGVKLHDNQTVEELRRIYEDKQRKRQESLRLITNNFDTQSSNFALISRTYEDLLLGDKTDDCTAYKRNHMNVWTLPNWLANPGFNFFTISNNEGKLVAKAGLLLAISDNEPTLVIDSLESVKTKGKEKTTEARKMVEDGLDKLVNWSKRVGLRKVVTVSYSNNQGVRSLIKRYSNPSKANSTQALGGFFGIVELKKNLGLATGKEQIYLQAVTDEGEIYLTDEISEMDRMINTASESLPPDLQEELVAAARNADWVKTSSFLFQGLYKELAETIGTRTEDYSKYFRNGELDTKLLIDEATIDYQNKITTLEQEQEIMYGDEVENMPEHESDYLDNEYFTEIQQLDQKIGDIVDAIRDHEELKFITEIDKDKAVGILRRLYGSLTVADTINLSNNLRELKIPK